MEDKKDLVVTSDSTVVFASNVDIELDGFNEVEESSTDPETVIIETTKENIVESDRDPISESTTKTLIKTATEVIEDTDLTTNQQINLSSSPLTTQHTESTTTKLDPPTALPPSDMITELKGSPSTDIISVNQPALQQTEFTTTEPIDKLTIKINNLASIQPTVQSTDPIVIQPTVQPTHQIVPNITDQHINPSILKQKTETIDNTSQSASIDSTIVTATTKTTEVPSETATTKKTMQIETVNLHKEDETKMLVNLPETTETCEKTGKNPFTKSGKLSRKADYIISHSTITRTNIRISDPDLPSKQPITEQLETEVLLIKPEAVTNGQCRNVVEVTCVKMDSPETDKAEQVKLISKKSVFCGRCCGECCCECCVKCCGQCCRCCGGCCAGCNATCLIQ